MTLFGWVYDIRDGHLHLPEGTGWRAEVDEEAVRAARMYEATKRAAATDG